MNNTGTAGAFNHDPAFMGSLDCKDCHTLFSNAASTVGVTWKSTGYYSHVGMTAGTSCAPCHGKGHSGSDGACDPATNANCKYTGCATSNVPFGMCFGCHYHGGNSCTLPTMPLPTGTAPTFGGDAAVQDINWGC
jgi:hypothetical protein